MNAKIRHPDPAENVDLFDYALLRDWFGFVLRSPGRNRALAAACFLAVLCLSLVSLKILPFRYQAQARILALRNPLMNALSNPGMNREWDAPTRAAREVVIRRDNLVALCKQTDFVNRYLKARAPAVRARDWLIKVLTGKERDRNELLDDLVDTLESRLWVVADSEGVVTITFQWSDRDIAYQIVQAAVQSFLEARYASEISAVGETIAILQGHDARVQKEIAVAIEQVAEKERAFRQSGSRRPVVVRPRVSQDEDLARLEGMLAAKRRALADLEDFRRRRLAELQAQLAQNLSVYAPQHPTVVTTQQSIESLSLPSPQITSLRAETQEIEREISRRGGRPAEIAPAPIGYPSELAEARLRLQTDDPRLGYERDQLQLLVRQHSNLLQRIDSARVEMDTAQAAFKYRYSVITPPEMPKKTIKAYTPMILLGGILGGIALAFFASAVADLRSRRIVERWQLERNLDVPVLAEIPR